MSVHSILNHLGENVKHIADGIAAVAAFGTLLQFLPPLASLLTIVWMTLRIYDWVEARFSGERLPKD
jgi:hypothetical protein